VSGSDLFIVNFTSGTIGEYTTSGATVNASLISGLSDPQGIAIAGSDLFVTSPSSGTISEYTTSGATVNASLFSNELPGPTAIAVSGSDLFVTQTTDNSTIGTIGEYTTSGAIVNGSLVSGLIFPEGIALYGSDLFVVDNDSSAIGEYTTSGATVNAALASGLEAPFGIAVATIVPTPQLAFAQQPTNATTTTTLGPITVDVEDASGDLLTSDNSNVTLTIANNPTGATLGGTATVAAVNGVATFSDLSITTAGDNYAFSATDGSDTAATSASFNIYPPPSKIGGLDPTFGVGGIASHDVGFSATNGVAQSGTQSVIIGTIGTSPEESFGITRYNADGSLDTAFGTNGVVTTSFAGTDDVPAAVDVLSSGEILVAGTAATFAGGQPVGSEFALAEYTADGALDPSFGVGGEVLFSFSSTAALSNDVLSDMAVSSTGIIYLAGSSDSAGTDNDFAIAAFNTDGSIDNGFGSGGHTLVEFAGEDAFLNAVALQSDGEIVAAGSATTAAGITSVALAGLLPTGILDPRFGTKGETITTVGNLDDEATSIAIQSDDKIVIGGLSASGSEAAGTLTSSFLVARYTSTGKIDRSFGGGPVVTPFGQPAAAVSVVIESDGDIIASGNTTASLATLVPSELDLALASYTTMGKLDPTFNGTGTAIISLSGNQPGASAVHTDALLMSPLDAGSDMAGLGLKFKGLEAKAKGVEQLPGGEISAVGNSGVDTVQAIIITSGSDLVALLTSGVPSAVVGGAKGSVSIRVVEDGSDFPLSSITIDLSVSQSSAGGGGPSFHSLSEKITLKPQKSKIFKLTFDYPSTLPNGNYYLLATVDTGTVQDLNLENNTAASNSAVEIAAAFIDLTGSNLTLSTFKTGKPAQVSFDIINNGNEPAKGVVSVEYLASVDKMQSDAITLMTVPGLSLNVKNASTKPAHQKLTIPTTLPAGTYYLLAVLDPANKLGDTDTSNNLLISSGQFTTT
jgi:uncharacterized delta-60 repeat protein